MTDYDFRRDPWGQAAINGLVALIPARSYPRWLRNTMVYGPALAGAAGMSYLVTHPEETQQFAQRVRGKRPSPEDPAKQEGENTPDADSIDTRHLALRGAALGMVLGAAMGASVRVAFWADEMIESQLVRLRVPLPRVAIGAATAASVWWIVNQENKQERQGSSPADNDGDPEEYKDPGNADGR